MLLQSNMEMRASPSRFASELMVLLGVTHTRLRGHSECGSSETEDLKTRFDRILFGLNYNQLKRMLLRFLAENEPMDSTAIFQKLASAEGAKFEIHAVRMALVRYYRQGLLKRERAGGQFRYTISGRGTTRLRWLEGQMTDSKGS